MFTKVDMTAPRSHLRVQRRLAAQRTNAINCGGSSTYFGPGGTCTGHLGEEYGPYSNNIDHLPLPWLDSLDFGRV